MRSEYFFSIIIPTYNRPQPLRQCLESLICLDYPRDLYEVLVVDDGSQKTPFEIVENFKKDLPVRLLIQKNQGPASARNNGAAQAKGDFLAFTDDDCLPDAGWLRKLAVRFEGSPQCAVGGRTVNAIADNVYSETSQMLVDYLYHYHNKNLGQDRFFTSNNIAISRKLFLDVGGFNVAFQMNAAEDREFCDRWLRSGFRLAYAPEIVIRHAHHLKLSSFFRQHFNYGQGAFRFHEIRKKYNERKIWVVPAGFYLRLSQYPYSKYPFKKATLIFLLLVLSQWANICGFFKAMSARKRQPDPLLGCIHSTD